MHCDSYYSPTMETINEQRTNLVTKPHQSHSQACDHCQREAQRGGDSCSKKTFWVAIFAMLILVALYLALRLEGLSDCSVGKEQPQGQIVAKEAAERKIDHEETVESSPLGQQQPATTRDVTKVQAENKQEKSSAKDVQRSTKYPLATKENDSYNLWTMSKEEKIELLSQIQQQEDLSELDYTPFLSSKDQQTEDFFMDYENRSAEIDWNNLTLSAEYEGKLMQTIKLQQGDMHDKLQKLVNNYKAKYQQKTGYMGEFNKGITYAQFFRSLQWKKMTAAQFLPSNDDIEQLEQQQRIFYQDKYDINSYEQLPLCIIMPTYNNQQNLRYVWSIESVLQQEYSNLRVIIIDDASKDKTAQNTAAYLKWRRADPDKYIVIAAKEHRTALQNIYYGVHKYCDYGQIFMIVDGDDELIGRQAFKTINALYQREKMYVLYSQFVSYDPKTRKEVLDIGISEDFPSFVKRQNSYRTFKHSYSQLRSMISDLILLQRASSFKLKSGRFFELLYDNAIFYPAFEMACQNIYYLPEIFYWYNMNTGVNDWYKAKTAFYKENRFGIELQKPYRCIEEELRRAKEGQQLQSQQ